MKKTVSVGVRIPLDLYNLTMSANPGKTFSDIVRNLLTKEYGFSCAQIEKKNIPGAQAVVDIVSSVEEEVDDFLEKRGKNGKDVCFS